MKYLLTEVEPPEFDPKTHTCKFDGSKWVTTKIPDPPKEEEPEPEFENIKLYNVDNLSYLDFF